MKHAPSHPRFQTLAAVRQKHVFKGCLFCRDSPSFQQFFFSKTLVFIACLSFFPDTPSFQQLFLFQRFFVFITCLPFFPRLSIFSAVVSYLSAFITCLTSFPSLSIFSAICFFKDSFFDHLFVFLQNTDRATLGQPFGKNETFAKQVRKEILFIGMVGKEVP